MLGSEGVFFFEGASEIVGELFEGGRHVVARASAFLQTTMLLALPAELLAAILSCLGPNALLAAAAVRLLSSSIFLLTAPGL